MSNVWQFDAVPSYSVAAVFVTTNVNFSSYDFAGPGPGIRSTCTPPGLARSRYFKTFAPAFAFAASASCRAPATGITNTSDATAAPTNTAANPRLTIPAFIVRLRTAIHTPRPTVNPAPAHTLAEAPSTSARLPQGVKYPHTESRTSAQTIRTEPHPCITSNQSNGSPKASLSSTNCACPAKSSITP